MRPLIQILKKVKWKIEEKKKNQNLFQIEGGGGGDYLWQVVHIIQDSEIAVVSSWSPIKNVEKFWFHE